MGRDGAGGEHFVRIGRRAGIGRARVVAAGGGQTAGPNQIFDATPCGCGLTRNEIQRDSGNEQRRAADEEARYAPGKSASSVAAAERTAGTAEPFAVAAPGRGEDRDGVVETGFESGSREGGKEINFY